MTYNVFTVPCFRCWRNPPCYWTLLTAERQEPIVYRTTTRCPCGATIQGTRMNHIKDVLRCK